MNNKLICPFCQQEYIITKDDFCFGQQRCVCRNPNCEFNGWHFPVKLVSELIRTRKALDVAVDEINKIKVAAESVGIGFFMTAAISALAKINTALEQKEHFADASKTIEQKD